VVVVSAVASVGFIAGLFILGLKKYRQTSSNDQRQEQTAVERPITLINNLPSARKMSFEVAPEQDIVTVQVHGDDQAI